MQTWQVSGEETPGDFKCKFRVFRAPIRLIYFKMQHALTGTGGSHSVLLRGSLLLGRLLFLRDSFRRRLLRRSLLRGLRAVHSLSPAGLGAAS
jgi:hypothetical protein